MRLVLALLAILRSVASTQEPATDTPEKPTAVTGRVTDRAGAPIRGAIVSAGDFSGRPAGRATTNDSGAYEMTVEPGVYVVRAEKPGYVSRTYSANATTADVMSPVRIGAGERKAAIDFSLGPGASIAGTVMDENGEPVRVAVQLLRELSQGAVRLALPNRGTSADEQGRYRFDGLARIPIT